MFYIQHVQVEMYTFRLIAQQTRMNCPCEDIWKRLYMNSAASPSLLRWSVTDSYPLALERPHRHPGHTSNNTRRDIDPLPDCIFLPLRGSSNMTTQLS